MDVFCSLVTVTIAATVVARSPLRSFVLYDKNTSVPVGSSVSVNGFITLKVAGTSVIVAVPAFTLTETPIIAIIITIIRLIITAI